MYPLAYAWPAGAAFWVAFAWAFSAEIPFTLRDRVAGPTDRNSMRVVKTANGIAAFAAFSFAGAMPRLAMPLRVPVYIAGIAAIVAGGLLRRHCFRVLGASFTYDVRVAPNQHLVERGAYKYVRHPSYTAGLLLSAGIGLGLGNWASLAAAIVLPALGYAYRIHVEEHALTAGLGPAYGEYMKRTPRRLIPFVC